MMKPNYRIFSLLFCITTVQIQKGFVPVQAFTKIPVADLVGNSLCTTYNGQKVVTNYNNLPLSSQRSSDCLRLHQLLFNEKVTILDQQGEEVLVQIPMVFYELEAHNQRYDTYWSLKKNFITLDELQQLGITGDFFPEPIDYKNPDLNLSNKKTIALTHPFHDSITNQTFSVGTRFIVNTKKKIRNAYSIFIFDFQKKSLRTTAVPFQLCRVENLSENYKTKMHDFVALLKNWIGTRGIIPYVWGGCSFTEKSQDEPFELIEKYDNGKKSAYYQRISCNGSPKNGFDCTGIVARAAQICGIPYYFKNSTTVAKYLKTPSDSQSCVEGDLIWIPGHIMVVADTVKNTIIEARAYDHGFGKVHEIPLSEVFKGVTNFAQLNKAYKSCQRLQRLDKQGKVVQVIDSFKVLKLESLWDKKTY